MYLFGLFVFNIFMVGVITERFFTDPIHVKCKCEKLPDKLRLPCSHITSITGIVIKLIRRNWFGSLNYNV